MNIHLFIYSFLTPAGFSVSLVDEEEDFPDDALSNHADMVDNEPVVNEARRQFMRYTCIFNALLLRQLLRLCDFCFHKHFSR